MTNNPTGFWRDFQKFLMRGNVVDLAVAVIIGAAFGKIINSLVTDIITPAILSPVLTSLHLNDLNDLAVAGIKYGLFLAAVINFVVIAFSIFLMIRAFESAQRRLRRQEALEAAQAPPDPNLLLQERIAATLDRLAQRLEERKN